MFAQPRRMSAWPSTLWDQLCLGPLSASVPGKKVVPICCFHSRFPILLLQDKHVKNIAPSGIGLCIWRPHLYRNVRIVNLDTDFLRKRLFTRRPRPGFELGFTSLGTVVYGHSNHSAALACLPIMPLHGVLIGHLDVT